MERNKEEGGCFVKNEVCKGQVEDVLETEALELVSSQSEPVASVCRKDQELKNKEDNNVPVSVPKSSSNSPSNPTVLDLSVSSTQESHVTGQCGDQSPGEPDLVSEGGQLGFSTEGCLDLSSYASGVEASEEDISRLTSQSFCSNQSRLTLQRMAPFRRGPGRPRKDGSCPTQRKKIFPGRPRMHSRKPGPGSLFGIPHSSSLPSQLSLPGSVLGDEFAGEIDTFTSDGLTASHISPQLISFETSKEPSKIVDVKQDAVMQTGVASPESSMPFPCSSSQGERVQEVFQERWPGKVCAFCNLGERSLLGQGELNYFEPTIGFNPFKKNPRSRRGSSESDGGVPQEKPPKFFSSRRYRGTPKNTRERSKSPRLGGACHSDADPNSIPVDELEILGFAEEPDPSLLFEPSGHFYAHHCCASWSEGVCQTEDYVLVNADKAVYAGMNQRCSYCRKFGATIRCRGGKCNRIYHYPCAASSGTFQDIKTLTLLCPLHLNQAPSVAGSEANCNSCEVPGNIPELLFCTSCGHHYHGNCLKPPVAVNPVVRTGWQCPDCKICQTCRHPGDDNKMLVCDVCDKGYHTYCLNPAITNIPKNGWKCKNCRVCGDCGSRTPGSGQSSRWHRNYTVCDSCYQQRNKGVACPLCGKAYRQFIGRAEMAQCKTCRKCIHPECDPRIAQQRQSLSTSSYICPVCNGTRPAVSALRLDVEGLTKIRGKDEGACTPSTPDTSMNLSRESLGSGNDDIVSNIDTDFLGAEKPQFGFSQFGSAPSQPIGFSQPSDIKFPVFPLTRALTGGGKFLGKRRPGVGRPRGVGKFAGKRRAKIAEFQRKRGPKPRGVKTLHFPGVYFSHSSTFSDSKETKDDEPGVDNKLVLCATNDEFVLSQDLCVMCGSFGKGEEGRLIACSQCGQCYHPYCVNVKVTKVIISKGWRCLDCTVCEGCGKPHDEGRLLLCDECDISYHTYCLDPPLKDVPQGNWKCNWCVVCLECGSRNPGYGALWQNNYTRCGPCASKVTCPVCHISYQENELIIQCIQCHRWLHGECDQMLSEEDAERASDHGYHCILCRPKDELPPHLLPPPPPPTPPQPPLPELQCLSPSPKVVKDPEPIPQPPPPKPKPQAQFYVDGVFLSESGMDQIRALTIEQPKKQRMRRPKHQIGGRPFVMGEDKDVVSNDIAADLVGMETDVRMEVDDGEDGMKGEATDANLEKKRRQRKLHKLGIGGFVARPRARSLSTKEQGNEQTTASMDQTDGMGVGDVLKSVVGEAHIEQPIQEKPKRRRRVKKKNPLEECFPSYLQEAFFGRELLETSKSESHFEVSADDSSSIPAINQEKTIMLSLPKTPVSQTGVIDQGASLQVSAVNTPNLAGTSYNNVPPSTAVPVRVTSSSADFSNILTTMLTGNQDKREKQNMEEKDEPSPKGMDEGDLGDSEALKDLLPLPQDIAQDDELMNMLMNDGDDLAKQDEALEAISSIEERPRLKHDTDATSSTNRDDPLGSNIDLLSSHFNLDTMVEDTGLPHMDSKDVEDIFKGVLTQEQPAVQSCVGASSAFAVATAPISVAVRSGAPQLQPSASQTPGYQSEPQRPVPHIPPTHRPTTPSSGIGLNSSFSLSSQAQFSTEFGSSQLSDPSSPWPEGEQLETPTPQIGAHGHKNILKWEPDEALGEKATISPVLYANINMPHLKIEYPNWPDRAKQIAKIWRSLSSEKRHPFLQKAKENRTASRMQKQQADSNRGTREPKGPKETEQELHWKQFQTLRQQKQLVQEHKVQAYLKTHQLVMEHSQGSTAEGTSSSAPSTPTPSVGTPTGVTSPITPTTLSSGFTEAGTTSHTPTPPVAIPSHPAFSQSTSGGQPVPSPVHMTSQVSACQSPLSPAHPQRSPGPSRVATSISPLIQVSRVRPPIDTNQLPPGDPYSQPPGTPRPVSAPDQFLARQRPSLIYRTPLTQPRPLFSPMSPGSQPRTESQTSGQDVFQASPATPSTDPYSQPPPTPRTVMPQDPYTQQPSTPHPAASPYSPSTGSRPSSATLTSMDPYSQAPPTPRPQQSVPDHLPSPSGTSATRYVPDLTRSQPPSHSSADPYSQPPLTPRPVSTPQMMNDPYAKQPATPRPTHVPGTTAVVSHLLGEPGVSHPEQTLAVSIAAGMKAEAPQMPRQQLRDLLQRQQLIKEQMMREQQGQIPLRHWPPEVATSRTTLVRIGTSQVAGGQDSVKFHTQQGINTPKTVIGAPRGIGMEDSFRQPLPPGMRPRVPTSPDQPFSHPISGLEHKLGSLRGQVDPRLRMIFLQQQLQLRGQTWSPGQMRMAGPSPRMSTGFGGNVNEPFDSQPKQQTPQPRQQILAGDMLGRFGQPAVCTPLTDIQQHRSTATLSTLPQARIEGICSPIQHPFPVACSGLTHPTASAAQSLTRLAASSNCAFSQPVPTVGVMSHVSQQASSFTGQPTTVLQQQPGSVPEHLAIRHTVTSTASLSKSDLSYPEQACVSETKTESSLLVASDLEETPRRRTTAEDLVKVVEEQSVSHEAESEMGDELDDDELLGLGNDFNILEYADPELVDKGLLGDGGKNNILDEHLDLDDKDEDLEEGNSVEIKPKTETEDKVCRNGIKQETCIASTVGNDKKIEKEEKNFQDGSEGRLGPDDFQAKFLEFSQRRDLEKVKDIKEGDLLEDGHVASSNIKKSDEPDPKSVTQAPIVSHGSQESVTDNQHVRSVVRVAPTESADPLLMTSSSSVLQAHPVNIGVIPAPQRLSTINQSTSSMQSGQGPVGIPQLPNQVRLSHPARYIPNLPPPPPYPDNAHSGQPPPALPQPQQRIVIQRPGHTVTVIRRPLQPPVPVSVTNQSDRRQLMQNQPLLLEELVEQEKQEQRRQSQEGLMSPPADALLSDVDFERLKADVLSCPPDDTIGGPGPLLPTQGSPQPAVASLGSPKPSGTIPPQFFHQALPRPPSQQPVGWQGHRQILVSPPGSRLPGSLHPGQVHHLGISNVPAGMTLQRGPMIHGEPHVRHVISSRPASPGNGVTPRPRLPFAITSLPAPPLPPAEPSNEQERQQQTKYEQWLLRQQEALNSHQKYFETEVGKLRKAKKALNAKQRTLRKNGQELGERDAAELERISQEQAVLQKQLDQARKQSRQHGLVIQDYRVKQQKKKQQQQQPQMVVATQRPVRPPTASQGPPTPHMAGPSTPQSPMMSPSPLGTSPSPRLQHSPSPLMQHSPAPMPPSPMMQHSPRMVTSQPEGAGRPNPVHVTQDDNNPFSESFQQREFQSQQQHFSPSGIQQQQHMSPQQLPSPGPQPLPRSSLGSQVVPQQHTFSPGSQGGQQQCFSPGTPNIQQQRFSPGTQGVQQHFSLGSPNSQQSPYSPVSQPFQQQQQQFTIGVQGIQQPRFLPPQTSSSPAPQQRQQLPTSGVSQPSQQQSQFSGPRDIPQHQRPQQFFPQAMQLRHLPPRSQAPQQFISQEGSQGDEEKRQQLLQQVKIFKENDTPFSQAPGQVGPRFALSSSSGQSFTRLVGPSVNHRIINRPGVATDLVGQPFPASLPTSAQGIRPGQVSVHSGMRRPPPPYPSHVKLTSPGPLDPSRSDSVLTTLTSSPGVYSCTSSISGTTVTSESSLSYSEEFKRKQPTTAILHNTSGPSVTVLSIRSSETELVRHDAQKEEISDNTGSSLSLNSQTLIPMGHSAVHPIPVSQKKNSSFSESFQVSQNSQTLYMSQNLPTSQNSANKEDTLQYPTEGKEEKKHVISSSLESAAYIENSSQEGFETNFIAMRGDNESARRKQASELLKSQTVTRTLHGRSSTENKTSSLKIENWPSVVQTSVLISKSNQEVSDENFQPGQQHGDSLQSQKESKDQQVASSSGTKASHVRKIVQGSSQIDQRDKFYQPNVTLSENLISSGQFPKSSISSQPLIHNTAKTSESSPSTCSDVCDNVMPSVTDSERFVLQHSQISGSTSISVENISVDKLSSSAFQKSQSEKRYDIIASPSSGHMYDHLADSTQSSSFNFKPADNEDNPPDKCSFNTDISSEEVSTTLVPKQEETKGDSEVSSSSATVIPTSSSTKEELCASDIKEETVEDLSEGTFELHVVGSPEGRANDSPAPMFPAKQEGKNQEDAELSCCSDSQTEGTDLSGYADKNVSQLTTASTSDFSTSMSSIKETTEAFSDKEFEPQKPLPPPSTTAKPEIPCASCSIPPSLVQSLPTSVTNTLNFTLRQTGMPNVSLPQEDGSLTSFPRTNTQGSFTASQALSGRPITTVLRSPQSSVPTAPQPNMEVSLSSVIQSRYPLTQQGKVMSGSPSFRKVEMSLPTEQFHSYPSTSISVVTVTPCRPKLETQTADELVKTSGGSWKDYPYQTDPSPRMITPNVSFSPCGTISIPNIKLEPQDPAAEVEVKQEQQEMISSVEARESMVAPEKPLGEVKTSVSVSQTIADQGAYQEQGSSSNLPSCKSETQKETLSRSFQDSFIGVPHDKNELKNELSNQKEPKMQTEMTYIDETKSCCAETAENFETKKCIKNETEVRKQTSDSEVYNNVQPQQQQDRKVIVETSVVNEEENSQEKSHCASESQDDSSREQSMSLEEGGNQNVLLKQLLRNFPSAETRRESEEFEDLVNKEEAKSATEGKVEPSSEDKDKEHPEEPKGKKPSYLDIRRAQLEKDPTPPPEDLKPKRKRPKKKKENKDGTSGKKRQRKGSKAEEDYDVFMAALMKQLRAMPPIRILEPYIKPNFNLCPVFGSRDCNNKDCQLRGSYGNATLSNQPDYYSTQPFGSNPPTPPASLPPTPPPVRGYYYQEFNRPRDQPCVDIPASLPTPPLYLDPQRNVRDAESPDTIISSSSPECGFIEPPTKFPGLRLIDSDESSNGERVIYSPTVPIVAPIPIRAVSSIHDGPPTPTSENEEEKDKENVIKAEHRSEMFATKTKMLGLGGHPAPLKDSGNVAVTLTLSSSASDDIRGVLNALADLLKIPPPATYDIVERTATPPSQKLGLYKKAKEPAANIHSLLNGKPRFCKHCDIVVLSAGIQKKASELPYISKDELEEDEVIFCSTNCYMQFALMHRSPSSSEQKEAAAVVSHLSNTTLTERHASAGENKGVTLSSESCSTPLTPTAVEGEAEAQAKLTCKNILQESDLHPDDSGLDLYGAEESAPSATSPLPETERTEEMEVSQDSEHIDGITEQEGVAHEQVGCLDEETTSSFSSEVSRARKHLSIDQQQDSEPLPKKWHGLRWKLWNESYASSPKYKSPSEEEVGQALDSISICVKPDKLPRDERKCVLCHEVGDGDTEGPARLLNADVNKWVHLNCALWSAEVYETVNGALINVDTAFKRALVSACVRCQKVGASLRCFRPRCTNVYHFPCAVEEKCIFYKDKTMLCPQHVPKVPTLDSELESVAVFRRVYINREEHKQIASMIHQGDKHLIRIGSLIFLNIGQLLPHQLQAFHSPTSIYPVGYKIVRMYWSIRRLGKRCRYVCSILDFNGKPDFQIQVQEPGHDELTLKDSSPKGVWQQVLGPIQEMRRQAKTINVFPNFITGEDLFGLTEPAIVHILESLPGVDTLTDYNFRYGRSPLLELPLAINPTGCARTEPKLRTHFKRPHTLHTSNTSRSSLQSSLGGVEISSPYIKQFVHSKSSQYRKMKTDWRNNVYLARSQIQGLGLYAARDIEKHTMVIEYIGMLIRNEIAERNEREYTKQNRGVYMFRLEENKVIDATLCGGLARYINHSCYPNCVAEEVQIDREKKIMIIANRRINRGEELTYDYRFEVEDDQHKIPCLCGAPNCRKWMN